MDGQQQQTKSSRQKAFLGLQLGQIKIISVRVPHDVGGWEMDKRPDSSLIVPFEFPQIPAEELEPEIYGTMGLLLGIISLILKIKLFSLFGLFSSIYSLMNQKESERQGLGSGISFSLVAVLINYVAPYFMPLAQSST